MLKLMVMLLKSQIPSVQLTLLHFQISPPACRQYVAVPASQAAQRPQTTNVSNSVSVILSQLQWFAHIILVVFFSDLLVICRILVNLECALWIAKTKTTPHVWYCDRPPLIIQDVPSEDQCWVLRLGQNSKAADHWTISWTVWSLWTSCHHWCYDVVCCYLSQIKLKLTDVTTTTFACIQKFWTVSRVELVGFYVPLNT